MSLEANGDKCYSCKSWFTNLGCAKVDGCPNGYKDKAVSDTSPYFNISDDMDYAWRKGRSSLEPTVKRLDEENERLRKLVNEYKTHTSEYIKWCGHRAGYDAMIAFKERAKIVELNNQTLRELGL